MQEFKYVIKDPEGIHARPAGLLVKKTSVYASEIKIGRGDKMADAKRIFGVMGLGVKAGDEIIITACGEDEATAIAEIELFFNENL